MDLNAQRFPSLLPKTPNTPHSPLPPPLLPPKRASIVAACDNCRQRKIKCDGTRPRCLACARHARECIYNTNPSETHLSALKRKNEDLHRNIRDLQKSHSTLQLLVEALQTQDEANALAIFQRIRQGADVECITRHLQAGDLFVQLHLAPETRFRYEFPYRPQIPTRLCTSDNAYLRSSIYDATFLPTDDASQPPPNPSGRDELNSPYLKPYMSATIVDPRLDLVQPSRWTSVSKDDEFLRSLLKLYFLYEYHFFSAFHKDLFLDDMLSGSIEFCSPLLVNAVLAIACNCCRQLEDRTHFWDPHTLGYKFVAEARRLWEVELLDRCSVMGVQAAIIMNIIYNLYAMDKVGMAYGAQAVRLARELKMFDGSVQRRSKREWTGYSFTAWSLYFWVTVKCYHMCLPPLLRDPPPVQLPDPESEAEWYTESWVRYPFDGTVYSLNHPHFFKAKCELSVIMNRASLDLFGDEDKGISNVPPERLAEYLLSLKAWYESLPATLDPVEIVYPIHFNLHILYQVSVMNVSEVLVHTVGPDITIHPHGHIQLVLDHARLCFETILRLYYLRHSFAVPDGHMTHNLVLLAYQGLAMRQALSPPESFAVPLTVPQEEARSTLILGAKGLDDQGGNYYLPLAVLQVIQHEMWPQDRELLQQYIKHREEDEDLLRQRETYVRSQYPVGLTSLVDRSGTRRLDYLQKQFTTMVKEKAEKPESSFLTHRGNSHTEVGI